MKHVKQITVARAEDGVWTQIQDFFDGVWGDVLNALGKD